MGKKVLYECDVFDHPYFDDLDAYQKLTFLHLTMNNLKHFSGIYKISLKKIVYSASIGSIDKLTNIESIDKARDILNFFIKDNKIKYDFDQKVIFIPNVYKRNKPNNKKIVIASLLKHYKELKTDFWNDFFDIYKEDDCVIEMIKCLKDDIPHTDFLMGVFKKTKKQEKKPVEKKEEKNNEDDFQKFWDKYKPTPDRYGKYVGKGSRQYCLEQFNKKAKNVSIDIIIKKLEEYLKHCIQNKMPSKAASTWINQKCWTGEYIIKKDNKEKNYLEGFDNFLK